MIVPSIDLQGGQAVQLIGGETTAIEAGDPLPIAQKFSLAGDIAVIDLDAALGRGDNRALIETLVRKYDCRVGGGIRTREAAVRWLDAGASQIIIGTAATPELLRSLPRSRVIAALDAKNGEVVVEGWQKKTGAGILERIAELKDVVGGFLVTFVEREGRMKGIDMAQVAQVVEAAKPNKVTVAGGVATAEEIAQIDRMGADVQVGMALYSGKISLADGIVAPIKTDRSDGLWATVIVDELGQALGLAWSDRESVRVAVEQQRGVYHSRSRGLWIKGETSGDVQQLLRIDLDCDRDAMRFTVRQNGGFCHLKTWTCWGEDRGMPGLEKRLKARVTAAPEGSYTQKLLNDPLLLKAKLLEEAKELADAAEPDNVAHEAADLFYFALTAMVRSGVSLEQVQQELDRRSRKLTRRPGAAKSNGE